MSIANEDNKTDWQLGDAIEVTMDGADGDGDDGDGDGSDADGGDV